MAAPGMTDKRIARGQILFQHGKLSEAQDEFKTCILLMPKDSKGYVALAETQVKMGDPAAARTTLESAAGIKAIGEDEKLGRMAALHIDHKN